MSINNQKKLPKLSLLALYFACSTALASDVNQLHSQAIDLARQGKVQQSYQELVLLHGRYPKHLPVLYDLVEIAARAGELQQSFNYGQKITNPTAAPAYVLEYLGKVARNVGEYALSYRYYQALYQREPKADYLLGSVLATSLSGQYDYARKSVTRLRKRFPNSAEYFIAKGFLQTQQKTYSQAGKTYLSGLETHPNHPELLQGLLQVYQQLGAFTRVQQLLKQHPRAFNTSTKNTIAGSLLANRVRWSAATRISHADENQFQQATIEQLEIASQQSGSSGLRAKFDLLVAYAQMNMAVQAVELYELMLIDAVQVPNYAKAAVAKAYLEMKEPEKTISIYQKIYPDKIPYEAQQGLFYAYTDLRQFERAETMLATMRKENPEFLGKKILKIPENNLKRIDIELYDIDLKVAEGDLETAYQQVNQLADEAPSNVDIRAKKATIADYRGWHEAAETDYQIATNLDPNRLSIMLDRVNNDMNSGNYDKARNKLQLLLKLRPNNRRVLQTQEEWQRRSSWQVNSSVRYADNKDSVFGRNEIQHKTTITAPRIKDKWRLYASHEGGSAGLSPNRQKSGRTLAGIDYESGKKRTTFALGSGDNGRTAGDLTLSYRLNDYWKLGLGYQKNTIMPIQAVTDNVDGNRFSTSIRYRADETFAVDAVSKYTDFSDGNRRLELALVGEKQLYQSPDYTLKGRLRGDYNRNRDVPSANYFNPSRSNGVVFSLDNIWLSHARYDFKFSQRLLLEAGITNQAGFGGDGLGSIRYGHDWQVNKDIDVYYYVDWKSQVYDGERENNMGFMFGFNWQIH